MRGQRRNRERAAERRTGWLCVVRRVCEIDDGGLGRAVRRARRIFLLCLTLSGGFGLCAGVHATCCACP